MPTSKLLSSSIALTVLLLAGTAHAEGRRSNSAMPTAKVAPAFVKAREDSYRQPTHVGPKGGFHQNHGLEEAMEHANEHSAHHRRNDSEG